MVSNTLQHKRSLAALPLPVPRSATPTSARWSGDSLTPNDGYSSLFTSGLMREPTAPTTPQLKCRPSRAPSAFKTSYSPLKTPVTRRRRSSILVSDAASPAKNKSHGTPSQSVESALDNVMRNLRLFSRESRQAPESRWSDSSSDDDEGSARPSVDSHKPRKSIESARSRMTVKSKRNIRSLASFKTRKSEDVGMQVDSWTYQQQVVPPVPAVPAVPPAPVTPGRGRRALEGLAKKLGLTPRKNKRSMPPPDLPSCPIPDTPLPLPRPSEATDRNLPRKSSFSTIRSLGKKASNGTLRSVRTTHSSTHPFLAHNNGSVTDCETPPLPGCVPSTPRRAAKSSIGHPKARPTVSPSAFLYSIPRRAPSTPKAGEDDTMGTDDGEVITFGTPDLSMTSSNTHDTSLASLPPFGMGGAYPAFDPDEIISSTPNDSMVTDEDPQGTPLTAKAAQVKPKKIIDLLPKSSRENLGLASPQTPARGLRSHKSRDDMHMGASMPTLKDGLPAPPSSYAAKSHYTPSANRCNPTRHPLAAIGLNSAPLETPALPTRSDTATPWTSTDGDYFGPALGTFGATNALHSSTRSTRSAVPDFSKPRDTPPHPYAASGDWRRAKGRVNTSIDSTASARTGASTSGAGSSGVSVLGTAESGEEGWELEKYLRELEGEDVGGPMVI